MLTYAKRGWFVPCIASVASWSLVRDDLEIPGFREAYNVLTDQDKRRRYDTTGRTDRSCIEASNMSGVRAWGSLKCHAIGSTPFVHSFACLLWWGFSPFSPACTKLRELYPNNHRLWAIPKCLWHASKLFRTNLGWSMAGGKPYLLEERID